MKLPVGYFKFNKNEFINYQLNRWYSLGYTKKGDIEKAGASIRNFKDYVNIFKQLAKEAQLENQLKNAAFYLRAAEFLVEPKDAGKLPIYKDFVKWFDRVFESENFERHKIPYESSFLSAMKFPAANSQSKGTIVAMGGFDSFIEDFYCMWKFFAGKGYDVIAFEGPGQGATMRLYNVKFDHDYEKPVAAVLNYFKIEDATLWGVSMGGYWVMRAAAFEKRVKRVIAMAPVYDWLELTNSFNKKLVKILLKFPRIMNFLVRLKMNVGILKHSINQTLFFTGKIQPIDAVKWMLGMNKEHIHSELVTQDVLLLTGENDAFQPPKLLHKQNEALVNARSVTTRIFTKAEHADQHCQVGNIGLALQVILEWLEGVEN